MVVSIILQVLLGLGFLMFGFQKFTSEDMKKGFDYFGYGDGFRVFTGFVEMSAAIIIIVGIWVKPLAVVGGIIIAVTMIGALLTHVKIKDQAKNMVMPFVLLLLGLTVGIINWFYVF